VLDIIKSWVDERGDASEKIYNVVWSDNRILDDAGLLPPLANTVDVSTATYSNEFGAELLETIWVDPDFDPTLSALYFIRVLEIQTPRWTTFDAVELAIALPQDVPATIQERAWSSPIWYYPNFLK